MTVYAAGAVLWRAKKDALQIAVIHRGRYNDWSLPKGKVDPGESLPQTAVREIREETGLKIHLGVPLTKVAYKLASGADKEVHYWAAKVTTKALLNSKFKPSEEVAEVTWLPAADAIAILTYPHDAELVREVVALHERGELNTRPIILLRHAKAMPRSDFKGTDDGKRPLLPFGLEQAAALIPLIGAYGVKRVVSSPWARCMTTVEPYAKTKKLPILKRSALSEAGNDADPARAREVIDEATTDGIATVICSHRPALPNIIDAIARFGTPGQEILLNESRALRPAEMTVIHLTRPSDATERRIVAIETQYPVASEN
jgi:8-oxo-dGTP pyrophosphatase MutT (NUDIX family)/phosphohistidine phosphatase SixA